MSTSTRLVNFADGTGAFNISAREVDAVQDVRIIDRDGEPQPVDDFTVDELDEHPGVVSVTVSADVPDGPHSVQSTLAE